jgi:hypothetical protein
MPLARPMVPCEPSVSLGALDRQPKEPGELGPLCSHRRPPDRRNWFGQRAGFTKGMPTSWPCRCSQASHILGILRHHRAQITELDDDCDL